MGCGVHAVYHSIYRLVSLPAKEATASLTPTPILEFRAADRGLFSSAIANLSSGNVLALQM
jgi:hypothetical protein